MKVSQEHGKSVDAVVSELQRQNWGFRSDYAHHDGSYGSLSVSDRRQPSPITPQVLSCKASGIRPHFFCLFSAARCVRTGFTNCGWTYSNAGVKIRIMLPYGFILYFVLTTMHLTDLMMHIQINNPMVSWQFVREVRKASPLTFIAIWSSTAAEVQTKSRHPCEKQQADTDLFPINKILHGSLNSDFLKYWSATKN